jgi:hypothetical protein
LDFKSVTLPNLGASPKLSGNFHPNGGVWHPHGVVNFGRCYPDSCSLLHAVLQANSKFIYFCSVSTSD